ncbi:MAG: hypothetical protein ACXWFB_11295 [Nitrososphaeraceae archaeon]
MDNIVIKTSKLNNLTQTAQLAAQFVVNVQRFELFISDLHDIVTNSDELSPIKTKLDNYLVDYAELYFNKLQLTAKLIELKLITMETSTSDINIQQPAENNVLSLFNKE